MPDFFRDGEYQSVSLVTGPNYVGLSLVLADEPDPAPYVIQIRDPRCGDVDPAAVRTAVATGVNEANARFGTRLHPWQIRFAIERWSPELLSMAAYQIIENIATSGRSDID